MASQTFETSEHPTIKVPECLGNLSVKGTDGATVTIKASSGEENLKVVQEEDVLVIKAKTDCKITCPYGATLVIEAVRGDLRVKGVHGESTIGEVNGDATIRSTGEVTVGQVHGDLYARKVENDLTVQTVAGDAGITDVAGQVTVGQIGSDLKAGSIGGGLEVNAVGADVILSGPFEPGTGFALRAGSDLVVRVAEEASLRFTIQAGSGVHAHVPGIELIKEDGNVSGVIGEGGATLTAQVGGQAVIATPGAEYDSAGDFDVDIDFSFLEKLDELGPIIEARVAEAMSHLEVQLEEGLKNIDGERIRIQVERATERAARAAERIAERATQAAEREAERARRTATREAERARMRAEHAERRWQRASGHRPPTPPTPSTPPVPPVPPTPPEPPAPSSPRQHEELREERLQVLKMVEEGKISAEEAANLLSALR